MENDIKILVKEYIFDPNNPELNFNLGIYYDSINQIASAVSYYLRSAERTDDDLLKYECLLRASGCFSRQGSRNFTVKGLIQHAIATCPKRPEAYFYMSRFYEFTSDWHECYLISSIGAEVCDRNSPPLRSYLDYPGFYGLEFMKSVSGWWCGLCDDSRNSFIKLLNDSSVCRDYKNRCFENLLKITSSPNSLTLYNKSKYDQFAFKFNGIENIDQNYSESYQDMFILSALNGKNNGTYLEIGAGNTFYGNNTALLETKFDWKGVSLDIDERFVDAFSKERKNICLLKDATRIDYEKFLQGLGFYNEIDYLQLDCDPPEVTYKILLSIPFDRFKFAVITYEHDHYCDNRKEFQEKSKQYLESYGYVRVVNNIAPDNWRSYEDWWVHPDLVDSNILQKMLCVDDRIKKAEDYMLGLL
jgi:tetratricopeptide (TPR) repeat protein